MQSRSLEISKRKAHHIALTLEADVSSTISSGFDSYRLRQEALPEIALDDVSLETRFLTWCLRAPLLISSMTGGVEHAAVINRNLAIGAQACGVAMALGSVRVVLEHDETFSTFDVRRYAPNVPLIANIGAVQLNYGVKTGDIARVVARLHADALYLHLNPLQEALQHKGNTNFRNLAPKIASLCASLDIPVLVKAVGEGIDASTAERLMELGIAAIDVAGAGGTSWARVEGLRAQDSRTRMLGELFSGWGYPTTECIVAIRKAMPDVALVASGGIRHGLDVAKALGLGADLCGVAREVLRAATVSAEAVVEQLSSISAALRIAMFAAGASGAAALRGRIERLQP